jgi:excisionase family DNA binding protein
MNERAQLNILSPAMAAEIRMLIDAALDERLPVQPGAEAYLSVKEAAALSGLEEQTIRKWISQRRIRVYKAGRAARVKLSEIVKEKD